MPEPGKSKTIMEAAFTPSPFWAPTVALARNRNSFSKLAPLSTEN